VNKEKELEAFYSVFGKDYTHKVIPHEKPDFLIMEDNKVHLGVEITEIYSHETDAKLTNMDGYSLGIINGTKKIHKNDKKNIKVDNVTINDSKGNNKGTITAIIQETQNFQDRINILEIAIAKKEKKIIKYLESCENIDLIINDSSNLFYHETFEEFYKPYSILHNKENLVSSSFREIYLVTSTPDKNVYIPLKGNVFLSDCFAYEMLLKNGKKIKSSPIAVFEMLLASLYLSGYTKLTISSKDGELGIHFGPWEMHYSPSGKCIRDRTLLFNNVKTERISDLFNDFSKNSIDRAKSIVKKRSKMFSFMDFSLPTRKA